MNKTIFRYGFNRILGEYDPRTQRELKRKLADELGITRQRVYQIINAEATDSVNIPPAQLEKASKVLKCSISDLLTPSEMLSAN